MNRLRLPWEMGCLLLCGTFAMSDNLVLEPMRAIRGDIAALAVDVRNFERCLLGVELTGMFEQTAIASLRTDTLEDWIERIERRSELTDYPPA